MSMSKPLTFGELNEGDMFIAFPVDGDDSGHGGYRNGSYLFLKTGPETAVNVKYGTESSYHEASWGAEVIKVLL